MPVGPTAGTRSRKARRGLNYVAGVDTGGGDHAVATFLELHEKRVISHQKLLVAYGIDYHEEIANLAREWADHEEKVNEEVKRIAKEWEFEAEELDRWDFV